MYNAFENDKHGNDWFVILQKSATKNQRDGISNGQTNIGKTQNSDISKPNQRIKFVIRCTRNRQ